MEQPHEQVEATEYAKRLIQGVVYKAQASEDGYPKNKLLILPTGELQGVGNKGRTRRIIKKKVRGEEAQT